MSRDAAVIRIFNAGGSYRDISEQLGMPLGTAASTCKRLGLRRNPQKVPVISPEERAERELDQRDIDILHDLDEGHGVTETAKHWGVKRSWVRALASAAT
jgi:hypothetical protein